MPALRGPAEGKRTARIGRRPLDPPVLDVEVVAELAHLGVDLVLRGFRRESPRGSGDARASVRRFRGTAEDLCMRASRKAAFAPQGLQATRGTLDKTTMPGACRPYEKGALQGATGELGTF